MRYPLQQAPLQWAALVAMLPHRLIGDLHSRGMMITQQIPRCGQLPFLPQSRHVEQNLADRATLTCTKSFFKWHLPLRQFLSVQNLHQSSGLCCRRFTSNHCLARYQKTKLWTFMTAGKIQRASDFGMVRRRGRWWRPPFTYFCHCEMLNAGFASYPCYISFIDSRH